MDKLLIMNEAKDLCSTFRKEFQDRFGVQVYIYFSQKALNAPALDLEVLEEVVNLFIIQRFGDLYPDLVRQKTRVRDLVIYRQMLFYIAISMGYSLCLVARFYGKWNHATVWHSCNVVENYLDTKDKGFMKTFNTIKDAFEERLRNGGNIQAIPNI